jgi:hypothetical protein
MMPCSPAMMFCSIVGQASLNTAGPMGPSTIERSNFLDFDGGDATKDQSTVIRQSSYIEFFSLFRAFHDEPEPRGCVLAHQLVDDAIGDDLVGYFDAE